MGWFCPQERNAHHILTDESQNQLSLPIKAMDTTSYICVDMQGATLRVSSSPKKEIVLKYKWRFFLRVRKNYAGRVRIVSSGKK